MIDLTSSDSKVAKYVRQICGIGLIEAVSLKKATGCRTLVDFVNWSIDFLAYNVTFFIT